MNTVVFPRSLILALSSVLFALGSHGATLEETFRHPSIEARPWVYWVWLQTPTTHEAITRDLEEMKAKGIFGFILYDAGANAMEKPDHKMVPADKAFISVPTHDYDGAHATPLPRLATWSPEWRKEIRYVASESKRLGIKFCLACGLAGCSAPGLDPQYGEQQLISSGTNVAGPVAFDASIPLSFPRHNKGYSLPQATSCREVALLAVPIKDGKFAPSDVRDISGQIDASGRVRWDVPAGAWRIIRFAQTPIGIANSWGLFCDHLSAEAFDQNWALTMTPLLKEMTPEERSALESVEDDSWEAGNPTWTISFPAEFRKRRGYDIFPYLPLLAGQKMADDSVANRFRRDYAVTVSDLEVYNYYHHMNEVCHANGLELYSEANGPNYHGIDVTQSGMQVDHAMAEFWMPSAHRSTVARRFLARDAVTSNHIRGEPVTMCEAFTSLAPIFTESPFSMKACADQAFADGVNSLCIHNYSHSPLLDAKPGDLYFAGTHINRNLTWWDEAAAFFDYLARCSGTLQQGHFVADALFYIGDGVGQDSPRKMVFPTLGPGYDYDRIDATSLIKFAGVKDGRIQLSTGMSYRLLILPGSASMTLDALRKIASLVESGATIVGPRPTGLAGISPRDSPDDMRPTTETGSFDALVKHLWGDSPAGANGKFAGHGHVFEKTPAYEVLQNAGIRKDFDFDGLSPHGELDWIHRATAQADIYFVDSRWFPPEKVTCKFRVADRQPELWDPVTGQIRDAVAFRQSNGQTEVPIEFGPCGSVFVIFQRPISPNLSGTASTNYPAARCLGQVDGPWTVTFDSKWGGPPRPVSFRALTDWTTSPDLGIKYYSGTATYHANFDVSSAFSTGESIFLDLGDVHEVATVSLNGKDLGVVWSKPARIDITSAVIPKGNDLLVKVVNLWGNRLIGDAFLPPEKQFTQTNLHYYTPASPLLPSGLLGPVQILAIPSAATKLDSTKEPLIK